jgi:hypothetical protein
VAVDGGGTEQRDTSTSHGREHQHQSNRAPAHTKGTSKGRTTNRKKVAGPTGKAKSTSRSGQQQRQDQKVEAAEAKNTTSSDRSASVYPRQQLREPIGPTGPAVQSKAAQRGVDRAAERRQSDQQWRQNQRSTAAAPAESVRMASGEQQGRWWAASEREKGGKWCRRREKGQCRCEKVRQCWWRHQQRTSEWAMSRLECVGRTGVSGRVCRNVRQSTSNRMSTSSMGRNGPGEAAVSKKQSQKVG